MDDVQVRSAVEPVVPGTCGNGSSREGRLGGAAGRGGGGSGGGSRQPTLRSPGRDPASASHLFHPLDRNRGRPAGRQEQQQEVGGRHLWMPLMALRREARTCGHGVKQPTLRPRAWKSVRLRAAETVHASSSTAAASESRRMAASSAVAWMFGEERKECGGGLRGGLVLNGGQVTRARRLGPCRLSGPGALGAPRAVKVP